MTLTDIKQLRVNAGKMEWMIIDDNNCFCVVKLPINVTLLEIAKKIEESGITDMRYLAQHLETVNWD